MMMSSMMDIMNWRSETGDQICQVKHGISGFLPMNVIDVCGHVIPGVNILNNY